MNRTGRRNTLLLLVAAVSVAVGTLPAAPTSAATTVAITSAPPTATNSRTATIRWTRPTNLAVTCRLDDASFRPCSGTSATFRRLRDGVHRFQLRFPRRGRTVTVSTSWRVDTVAPAGGRITVAFTDLPGGPAHLVSFDRGRDAASGIATWRIRERRATLSNATCGAFGAATVVGDAKPTDPFVPEDLPANGCVRHELVVTDRAGNSRTYVDTFNGPILRDSTPPVVTLNTISATSGFFTVSGTVSDPQSGIRQVRVTSDDTAADPTNGPTNCTIDAPAQNWSCQIDLFDGTWVVAAVATNRAGGTAFDLQEDVQVRGGETGIEVFCSLCATSRIATEGRHALPLRVSLPTEPFADVTVTFAPDADYTVSPSSLTFTPDDFDIARTITVTAVDDATVESDEAKTLTAVASSTDGGYDGATGGVTFTIHDDDSPRVFLATTNATGVVREGGLTATRQVSLGSAPTSNVTVTFTSDKGGLAFSPATMTFTPSNFATPQTVTVSAVDDDVAESSISHVVTGTAASTDTSYASVVSSPTTITENGDNDSVRLVMDFVTNLIAEGGPTRTVDVRLGSRPTATVTVTFSVSGDCIASDMTITPGTMTFTTSNATTTQVLSVTAVNDAVDEGLGELCVVTGTASTSDSQYSGSTSGVSYFIDDND